MTSSLWEFWIDVGGTFTDCIARAPDNRLLTAKVLSSGVTKGRIDSLPSSHSIVDSVRSKEPLGFWTGYDVRFLDDQGQVVQTAPVSDMTANGTLHFEHALGSAVQPGMRYELTHGDEAPLLAIRTILGLKLADPIPPVIVKLGTTRGTNALLTRRGARVAFVTTRGFADVLLIGNQDRPRLFDLAIKKPEPLFERVIEIDERMDASGNPLRLPDLDAARDSLKAAKAAGIESIAICLLHAFANGAHERLIEQVAREVGFTEISVSSRLSPLIKIVSRGDTTVADAYLNPILRKYVAQVRAGLSVARTSGPCTFSGKTHGLEAHATNHSQTQYGLKLMTSSGGLVDASNFVGKDSILSGPAGGVIGFSRVAQQAGFDKAIGFDMGGTSTDVSRFDGRYEYEFETIKAGVRIVAPMLSIETVAAGGGSVCGFDGVKLFVGPQSAGADPGPACYGRGGPLTITDINLYLGRVLPSYFPFDLEVAAVERRLTQLCDEIATSPLGKRYSPIELADGFRQIANANMVRAIRKISVAKGYDPADYVLVSFGGAGAQHACALAEQLGMQRILVHPYSGLLSAYGIGLADVRRFAQRSVLQPLDASSSSPTPPTRSQALPGNASPEALPQESTSIRDWREGPKPTSPLTSASSTPSIDNTFTELEAEALTAVRAEGIPDDRIAPPIRSLDLRYKGVEATINVPEPTDGDYARAYAERHQQLYGYVHTTRPLEVVAARVEVVGKMADPPDEAVIPMTHRAEPVAHERVYFNGHFIQAPIFHRDRLHAGDEISGPAILCEPTSTVVIEAGWEAVIGPRGEIVLSSMSELNRTDESRPVGANASVETANPGLSNRASLGLSAASPDEPQSHPADPVLLEIFNNLFASIAEQMGVTLQKTSVSTNVKERLDFSCAIFTPTGDLVVNAPHIPVHLGAMSETVKCLLRDVPVMAPGDVYVTNDPFRGGSHLPDVTVISPVHEPSTGELLFLTASRAHHAEIGGIVPGSMPPFSKNLAEEGVLIRCFRLVEGQAVSANDSSNGTHATNGTNATTPFVPAVLYVPPNSASQPQTISHEDALRELLTTAPLPTRNVQDNLSDISAQVAANNTGVKQLLDLVDRYSLPVVQAYMRHIQSAANQKMRRALAAMPDGTYSYTDHLDDGSPICATITIQGERATVDFTGTGPVLRTSNLNANRAITTAATLYVFRCLINEDIPLNSGVLEPVDIILPECLLNPPSATDARDCVAIVGGNVETSQRVVDTLLGALRLAAASQGTMNNLTFGDGTFGYYETICGGSGATPRASGADAVHTHMTNTRLTDAEVIERRYPVRVHEFSIRRGSGGNGKYRGGDGIQRRIEFLKPLKVSLLTERRGPYAPFGMEGGSPGACGQNSLWRAATQMSEKLPGKVQLEVSAGDILEIQTPGGGGWGPDS